MWEERRIRDLPWWFEIYHTAWILFFPAVWYFLGWAALIVSMVVVAAYFSTHG